MKRNETRGEPIRRPTVHELKIWPEYFAAIKDGSKTFEYRLNDRDFRVGDVLVLREWNNLTETYTGKATTVLVTYLMYLPSSDYVVMSVWGGKR